MPDAEVIVIGSGIGGLVVAGLLARYGRSVIVCESHGIPGGAGHAFSRRGFEFDSGPSFHCGLGDPRSFNPLRQVLQILEEPIETLAYEPIGHYHFPDHTLPIYGDLERYLETIATVSPEGSRQLRRVQQRFLRAFEGLSSIPIPLLRADLKLLPILLRSWPGLLRLVPQVTLLRSSVGDILDRDVRDPWVRRLIDLECFLISGLKAQGTMAPVMAFVFGERARTAVDYPLGGGGAIISALVRGLHRWGGELRLNSHVDQIVIQQGQVDGVKLRSGQILRAPIVVSNATLWDTVGSLVPPADLPQEYRQISLDLPPIDSFMHLHLGIRGEGLSHLTGHHVVVQDLKRDITEPGNTCMISIPTVWDPSLAPEGHHSVHVYSLEPFSGWSRSDPQAYAQRKRERAQPLFQALETVIPDLRERIVLELIGTPLTHAHYLRRHQGSYGPRVWPGQGMLPGPQTPIPGLYRVGDTTLPGIGVPAVATSGILCANTLTDPQIVAAVLRN